MLKLPDNWYTATGGEVALHLLGQIPARPVQVEFARYLIAASLELAHAVSPHRTAASPQLEPFDELTWQVGNLRYTYLAVVDDDAVEKCEALSASDASTLIAIVPENSVLLLRSALKQILADRSPGIFSFADFIGHRTAFASVDARWTGERTLLELLARYNKRVVEAIPNPVILVDIPAGPCSGSNSTRIRIPTCSPESDEEYDYSKPHTLTLQETGGLRVVMGEPDDERAPDVLIERAVDLWRVIVHPDRGDPVCTIEISKDRTIILDESGNTLLEQRLS